jgi:hypothetical protein
MVWRCGKPGALGSVRSGDALVFCRECRRRSQVLVSKAALASANVVSPLSQGRQILAAASAIANGLTAAAPGFEARSR